MSPVRRLGAATHFIRIRRGEDTFYKPTDPSNPNAVAMQAMAIPPDKVIFRHFVFRVGKFYKNIYPNALTLPLLPF